MDRLKLIGQRKGYGMVTITSGSPKTQFFLDGRFVGQGQRRVLRRIPVGQHRIHAVVDGRKSPERRIEVMAKQQLTVAF